MIIGLQLYTQCHLLIFYFFFSLTLLSLSLSPLSLSPSLPQDVVDFRPKYRPMQFELRVFPHDHDGFSDQLYAVQELLVAQDTLVYEVVDLLCNSS